MKRVATIIILALGLFFAGCIREKQDGGHLEPGTPMPEFSVTGPSGTVSTDDLAGKRTLVVLFRSGCPDCRRELPKVEAAFEVFGEEVGFVAISKEREEVVAQYWTEAGYTMPYYIDGDGRAFPAFEVKRVPTLYLFGADGKVSFVAVETFDFDAGGLINIMEER